MAELPAPEALEAVSPCVVGTRVACIEVRWLASRAALIANRLDDVPVTVGDKRRHEHSRIYPAVPIEQRRVTCTSWTVISMWSSSTNC